MSTQAPTRLLAAFIATKAKLLAALKDEGGLFECRFLANLIERERTEVDTARVDAEEIGDEVAQLRRKMLRDLAPDDRSPGVIDAREAQELLHDLSQIGTNARHHVGHLTHLL
ncbi:MAG TPA: hypothetical protein VHD61_15810 [Lacunisphaera sp.]|nr:hypothetical protein [Lacunisphaera sp.]